MNAQVKTAQHTPGPWYVNPGNPVEVVADAEAMVIARTPPAIHCRRAPANANLIAAAPALYVALERMLAQVKDFHDSTGHEENGSVQCDALCALMPEAEAALAAARGGA